MTTQPLVSVVIPVFNDELFVEQAIRSVLEQTYRRTECIVVDDGSDDATPDIIEALGSEVIAIRTDNRGVAAARNLGATRANGDYLAFLDADDVWLPRKLELQVERMNEEIDLMLTYTGLHLIDEMGRFIGRVEPPPASKALRNTILLEPPPMSIAQTSLIRIAAFHAEGGFDEALSTTADADLACRLALAGPVAPIPLPLVLYRRHPEQMHLDPHSTRREWTTLFDKLFGDPRLPSSLRGLRPRAEANLQISLAGRFRLAGDKRRFVRSLARAALRRPDRVVAAVGRLTSPTATGQRPAR